jgi:hypothetical protein
VLCENMYKIKLFCRQMKPFAISFGQKAGGFISYEL